MKKSNNQPGGRLRVGNEETMAFADEILLGLDYKIFNKYFIEGLEYKDIAIQLNIGTDEVMSSCLQSIRRLRSYCRGHLTVFERSRSRIGRMAAFPWSTIGGVGPRRYGFGRFSF